jgi:signal transduction histidine kinase
MQDRIPFDSLLIEGLGWLIRLRWLVVLGFAAAVGTGWLFLSGELPWVPLLILALLVVLYNVQSFFYTHSLQLTPDGTLRQRQATRFSYLQTSLDLLALAALVHLSSGAESPAIVLLPLPTVFAGLLLSQHAGVLAACMTLLLFLAIVGLEYVGILPHYHLPPLEGIELYRQLPYLLTVSGMLATTLGLAAYLTSGLRGRLRAEERELVRRLEIALQGCRQLESANARLQRMDAEGTRFLTTVAHELRAPLNTIHTCIELALAGYASPEKVREILERVLKRTSELSELISDLLRLARARDEASRSGELGLVEPAAILQSVVELMRTEASAKDLFLSMDLDADLAQVRADPERLKLVWTNLLSNAIKYTEPGGIVAVGLKQSSDHLEATVRDTGIGIPLEEQEQVFGEFYRATNAREASPVGTGIGLAIVQRIVENFGGQIYVESELGLGSKFTVILPRADTAQPE